MGLLNGTIDESRNCGSHSDFVDTCKELDVKEPFENIKERVPELLGLVEISAEDFEEEQVRFEISLLIPSKTFKKYWEESKKRKISVNDLIMRIIEGGQKDL